jgi:hypothetical protein
MFLQMATVVFVFSVLLGGARGSITFPPQCQDKHGIDLAQYANNYTHLDHHLSSEKKRISHVEFFTNFFSLTKTGVRLYKIKNKHIVYLQMRKAGSEFINYNLETLAHIPAAGKTEAYQSIEASNGAKNPDALKTLVKKFSVFPNKKSVKIFTFVREPIERFISAVNEIYYRKHLPLNSALNTKSSMYQQIIDSNRLSMTNAKVLLDSILVGDLETLSRYVSVGAISHLYPLTNNLGNWRLGYVGRIENITTEWKFVEELYGIKLPLNKKFNRHRSSMDEFAVKRTLMKVIRQDDMYLQALCNLYRRDYECFQIPYPFGCNM